MTGARLLLCAAYALTSAFALYATWSQNLAYFQGAAPTMDGFWRFWLDAKVNPASRSLTVDLGLFLLAAGAFMITEARRLRIRLVWLYIVLGFLIAISVTFPLFMIARELKVQQAAGPDAKLEIKAPDILGLVVLAGIVLGMVWFYLS